MNRKKIIRITLSVLLVIAFALAFYAYREFNRKNESLVQNKSEFSVTATDLIQEFSSNEISATAKYSGRILEVEGVIKKVERDEKGFYTIILGDTSALSSVRCSVDSLYSKQAAGLATHTTILVKGVCTGFNADELGLGADVLLNRCVTIK